MKSKGYKCGRCNNTGKILIVPITDGDCSIYNVKGNPKLVADLCGKQDAAFIVLSVNNHTRLVEALREITEGKGAFNEDPMIHASNVIADMKRIAQEALASLEPSYPPSLTLRERALVEALRAVCAIESLNPAVESARNLLASLEQA